jgi:hypothetical protein
MKILNVSIDADEQVDANEPLWRYMKLSTFFSLIHGTVFIPSLKTLSKDDPKEGFLPIESPSEDDICFHVDEKSLLEESTPWLLDKATVKDRYALSHALCPVSILFRIWCAELQARRAVWCWHRSTHESIAMWNIYAHQGIAIRSSVAHMEKSLGFDDNWSVHVGALAYKQPEWKSLDYLRDNKKLLLNPFMFKSIDYNHEREVRIFLKINPQNPPCLDTGIRVPIDPIQLIDKVVVSPFINRDEQSILKEMLDNVFTGTNIEVRVSTGTRRYGIDNDFSRSIFEPQPCSSLSEAATNAVTSLLPLPYELPQIPFVEEEGLPDLLKEL